VLDVPHDGHLGYPGHTDAVADSDPTADTHAHPDPNGNRHPDGHPDRCLAGRAHPYIDAGSQYRGSIAVLPAS